MSDKTTAQFLGLNPLQIEAMKIHKVPGWVPWIFRRISNGVLCTGAVCQPITRGRRKGEPNYNKHDKATIASVLIPLRNATLLEH